MLKLGFPERAEKESVALLLFSYIYLLFKRWRFIMINNSSLKKWERLTQKQLNQQFVNEIINGFNVPHSKQMPF